MDIVIGLGETGKPLFNILKRNYINTCGIDIGMKSTLDFYGKAGFMNICIPYSDSFVNIVKEYQNTFKPEVIIIHSTVPIGTTSKISENAVHSPILGKHNNMEMSLKLFPKWIGGGINSIKAKTYFEGAGMTCTIVERPEITEALKLMCLAKYGMSIAFAQYQENICDIYDFPYDYVTEWDVEYNKYVASDLKRPILYPPGNRIGGHCVLPNTAILNEQHPNQILDEILRYK